jgi:hypothetical protein
LLHKSFLTWWCYCKELRFLCSIHGNKARHCHTQSKHFRKRVTVVLIKRFVNCSLIHFHSLTHQITHSLTHSYTHNISLALSRTKCIKQGVQIKV